MNWSLLGAIGELVGGIGVILTLGYLAVQIRHNSRAAQASMELEASKLLCSYVERVSGNPQIQRINNFVANEQSGALSPEDRGQYIWLMAEFFHKAEGVFIQRKAGFISDETWAEWERVMSGLLHEDITSDWWKRRLAPYSEGFYEFGDALMSQDAQWSQVDVSGVGTPAD